VTISQYLIFFQKIVISGKMYFHSRLFDHFLANMLIILNPFILSTQSNLATPYFPLSGYLTTYDLIIAPKPFP
jgi:hypothetical protein